MPSIKSRKHKEASSMIAYASIDVFYGPGTHFFDYFSTLLKNHPEYNEKISTGLSGFMVCMNGYKSKTLHIINDAGKKMHFSWVKCTKNKNLSDKAKLRAAFREAVSYQIISHPDRTSDNHIHHEIPFETLCQQFEELNPRLDYVVISKEDDTFGYKFSSQITRNLWQTYHAKEAILTAVTIEEHKGLHAARKNKNT